MSPPQINELARRIARSDPEDVDEQGELRSLLGILRDRVQGEKAHDVRLRLDSALLLMDYLSHMGGAGGDEVLRIVSRLVASLEPFFNPSVTIRKAREGEAALDVKNSGAGKAEGPLSERDEQEHKLIADMLLGEILVQFGTINSAQVCEALELQNKRKIRFGEALIELGAASRSDILSAVAYQDKIRREAAGEKAASPSAPLPAFHPVRKDLKLVSDMLLGDLLVRMGKITQKQLEVGLRAQRATGVRIGEALVQMKATTWADVEEALRVQTERRVSVI
jgi:hypothetical protein